ncbi:MAG: DNA polymerase IV [Planctomycetes bacterium]|nr:DNA polymerase IV [Planctomycetota bacterium]
MAPPADSGIARTILHADLDAFYAAVEQRDDQALRGRPVVVGGLGPRGVVATASYEARRSGVHSAMPIGRARRLCPDAVFLRPRMAHYAAIARTVRAVFERFTPLVEPLSLDEAFLDVTGSRALFGDGRAIAQRLRAEVSAAVGLTASVGVATSKFVAKVASDLRKPDALVVVEPGTEEAFLAPLPVARLWGAGPVAQERLRALGIGTIGELRRTPVEVLALRLGAHPAAHFAALARGDDPRPVVPERDAKSISQEHTFDADLRDDDAVRRCLRGLSEGVGRRLRDAGLTARVVRVKVRFPPFVTRSRQVHLPRPTDDDAELAECAIALVAKARASGRPVRLLGVGVAELVAREATPATAAVPQQRELFGDAGEVAAAAARADLEARRARLTRALDAIRDRFGHDAIRRGT